MNTHKQDLLDLLVGLAEGVKEGKVTGLIVVGATPGSTFHDYAGEFLSTAVIGTVGMAQTELQHMALEAHYYEDSEERAANPGDTLDSIH